MKKTAYSLKDVEWPRCADECSAVEVLGVGECEYICQSKFKKSTRVHECPHECVVCDGMMGDIPCSDEEE